MRGDAKVERIAAMGLKPAAQAAGISERTSRKWLKRFKDFGTLGLLDRSSRSTRTRTSINADLAQRIEGFAVTACPCAVSPK